MIFLDLLICRFLGFLKTEDVANIIYRGICSKKNVFFHFYTIYK